MGISTYQSYCGAQIFDAVGLPSDFVEQYFTGTATTIEGADLQAIAEEALVRHARAYGDDPLYHEMLDLGGDYAFRLRGEAHAWTPQSIAKLQHAVRGNSLYRLPGLCRDDQRPERAAADDPRPDASSSCADEPVPLDEVEPAADDRPALRDRRDELRLDQPRGAHDAGDRDEPHRRQVEHRRGRRGGRSASSRCRTAIRCARRSSRSPRAGSASPTEYLVNADVLQIKMAQGAKPGEGGQLPGRKVDKTIAQVRYSTPGVGLISPPPHHDIYSIEDLAQLIHDLKNANPAARISVKLVSEVGVGTVAAGVSQGARRPCDDRRATRAAPAPAR